MGSDFLSVGHLIIFCNQADDGCVISKFDDGVGAVGGHPVVHEQGVQERAKHADLRGANVESLCGGCGAAHPHRQPGRKFRIQS